MKQFVLIGMLFCYLFASSGVAVAKHFCSNELNSVSLFSHQSENCGCSKAKKSSCCHDESKFLKIKDSHISSKSLDAVLLSWIGIAFPQLLYVVEYDLSTSSQRAFIHQFKFPPDHFFEETSLSIKNCVWTI